MRIAVFTDTFPAISETFIARQIAGLVDLGDRVRVYAEYRPTVQMEDGREAYSYHLPLKRPRITYIHMPSAAGYWEMPVVPLWGETWLPGAKKAIPNRQRVLKALPLLVRGFLLAPGVAAKVVDAREYGYSARSLSSIYRLAALIGARGRYDVAHIHFGPVGNKYRFVRELWRVPLVVSFHGYDVGVWPRDKGTEVYSRLFHSADLVTANSNYTRRRLEALGCPGRKIRVLHMGLDLTEFTFKERTPPAGGPVEILSVGRLVEKKGFEYSIRAVARLHEMHLDLRYAILGGGPLREELQSLVTRLGLDGIVTLHGAASGEMVRHKMAQSHIFVAPSVTAANGDVEGQGLVLQEAQACGLPVLATDHDGLPEGMLPGRSGFLVPERDVDAMAGRLAYMVEHSDRWAEWGRAGRAHVEKEYDICKLSHRLKEIYSEAATLYKTGRRRR